jgi:hypothetical protein
MKSDTISTLCILTGRQNGSFKIGHNGRQVVVVLCKENGMGGFIFCHSFPLC